jgi:hypothetical protein
MRSALVMSITVLAAACSDPVSPAGPPVLEFVSPPPERMLPGQAVRTPVVVRAADAEGRPIPGLPLVWSGDGTVEPIAETTDERGEAAAEWTLPRYVAPRPYDLLEDDWGTAGPTGRMVLRVATGDQPALSATVDVGVFRVERLDAGFLQACGIVDRALWCWGSGLDRQLLVPGSEDARRPIEITAIRPARHVAVSEDGICALDESGAVQCSNWGTGRSFVPVRGAPPLVDLEDAGAVFCGRAADSTAWCWRTTGGATFAALQVSASLRFAQLAGGESGFVCGRTAAGTAWCWGRNEDGQLGNGSTDSSAVPVPVSGSFAFRDLAASGHGACGIALDESIWCWGKHVVPGGSTVPARPPVPAGTWFRLAGGWMEHYVLGLRTTASWFELDDSLYDPVTEVLPVAQFSAENGQTCIVVAGGGEVYCSWILAYGGGDSSLFPSRLVPVSPP